jgi:hypothetical protein
MWTILRRAFMVMLALVAGGLFYLVYYHRTYHERIVSREFSADGRGRVTILSPTYLIDKIYPSMMGPYSNQWALSLLERPKTAPKPAPELLWLTGIRTDLVAPDGASPMSREFFCHSNLVFTPEAVSPRRNDGTFTAMPSGRLFTLIPGRLEIKLPEGYGVPIYSDEPLDYFTMSLNLNVKEGLRKVRCRTAIDFIRDDAPAAREIKPLFRSCVLAYEPIGVASPHGICHGGSHPGAACGPFVGKAASSAFVASLGKTNTMHWLIPPGYYESRVKVTDQLAVPYDTTAHYVTGHLHPYGKSLALVDATAKRTLFTVHAKDFNDRLGVAEMEELTFAKGVELFKDHEYELVTVYENTTKEPIDAMSILYVYSLDKQFRPAPVLPGSVASAVK